MSHIYSWNIPDLDTVWFSLCGCDRWKQLDLVMLIHKQTKIIQQNLKWDNRGVMQYGVNLSSIRRCMIPVSILSKWTPENYRYRERVSCNLQGLQIFVWTKNCLALSSAFTHETPRNSWHWVREKLRSFCIQESWKRPQTLPSSSSKIHHFEMAQRSIVSSNCVPAVLWICFHTW